MATLRPPSLQSHGNRLTIQQPCAVHHSHLAEGSAPARSCQHAHAQARPPARRPHQLRRRRLACSAVAAPPKHAEPASGIDWDNLGFGVENVGPHMYIAEHTRDGGWQRKGVQPFGNLSLSPAAQVLNYGQSIFEGLKAQRTARGGIVLFRPRDNAARMRDGAARLCMPPPPEALFLEAVTAAVRANAAMVPPAGKGALYLRPLLMGTGPIVGLGPAPSYTLAVFGAAVGSYFKGGQMEPIDLVVETRFHRAAPRGMGGTKCAGNYSPVLLTQLEAKEQGFADVVYLDARHDKYLEEVSSCNIFTVAGGVVRTPPLDGTILPGVTRRSVIALLRDRGYEVREELVAAADACAADEVFTTGTAVVVASVGSLTHKGEKHTFGGGAVGPLTAEVYEALTAIQQQRADDPHGWVYEVQ